MTDQNEREWPSFGDILEELNSLGRLPSSLSTPTANPSPLERSDAAIAEPPAVEPDPSIETTTAEARSQELLEEPNWAQSESLGETVAAEPDAGVSQDFGIAAPVDAIDWSSWEFEAAPAEANDLLQDFTVEAAPDQDGSGDQSPVFEFEVGEIDGGPLDSVATADAIETDLHELFGMVDEDDEDDDAAVDESQGSDHAPVDWNEEAPVELEDEAAEPVVSEGDDSGQPDDSGPASAAEDVDGQDLGADNVVPLHRPGDDLTHHLVGLDEVFDPTAAPSAPRTSPTAEFVGVESSQPKKADSWEYLRPDEDESVKTGVFSRRPKFFGGAERKARKAERKQAEAKSEATGPPCPKCESPGRIDLNDPVGGKIHCSCLECDHVWSELAPPSQESA